MKEAYRKRKWAVQDTSRFAQCKNDKTREMTFKEGCQIYGFMEVNRVGGSFHIAPGDSITIDHLHGKNFDNVKHIHKKNSSHCQKKIKCILS